ncbi:MAG TPA: DNA methyltransferase [Bryobacteraceae bacterium]|nr:DNA methyltransferase [Bryobacteraceae bacterium]
MSYLRDRLIVARELLADCGAIFVQINEQQLSRVQCMLDEIFGAANAVAVIPFRKTSGAGSISGATTTLAEVCDFLLWYARDLSRLKYRQLFLLKEYGGDGAAQYTWLERPDGLRRRIAATDDVAALVGAGWRVFGADNMTSASGVDKTRFTVHFQGKSFKPHPGVWKTSAEGMPRLINSERTIIAGANMWYVRYLEDFPARPINNLWEDTISSFMADKSYVVQTNPKVIERCMLMCTDPGDLVLDPTCGGGTTAYVAEQWGRRWITIDTSRVAIAIARQRLLTAKYEYFKLKDESKGVAGGFRYKTVPHITLKSIAQNTHLDPIFAKHEPILDARLADANAALEQVSDKLRQELRMKLALKQKQEGKKAITDADRRRWDLPDKDQGWQHWEVPFDTDPEWPEALKRAVEAYRTAWRAKMDEVNACIAANAEQEELVDQPEIDRKITRVSGPFTVEAVQPPEMSLGDAIEVETGQFAGLPEELETTFVVREVQVGESPQNVEAYLSKMVDLLRMDGVRFPDNKQRKFTRLDAIYAEGRSGGIHAEGRWVNEGETDDDPQGAATVGVVFGPQYGPITAKMVEEVIRPAARRYDDLVFAGFSFDGPAQAAIEEGHPRLRIHIAHIRPDVNPAMNGLLKEQPGSQLFTVFGRPRTKVEGPDKDGMYRIEMQGVDIYDPVTNNIVDTGAAKVAAWFVDSDYDGRTFCITQAFFPDRSAWDKLSRALKGVVDEERFEALSGTVSLPFPAGKHKCAAVKVIDPRGNEVMRVHALGGDGR